MGLKMTIVSLLSLISMVVAPDCNWSATNIKKERRLVNLLLPRKPETSSKEMPWSRITFWCSLLATILSADLQESHTQTPKKGCMSWAHVHPLRSLGAKDLHTPRLRAYWVFNASQFACNSTLTHFILRAVEDKWEHANIIPPQLTDPKDTAVPLACFPNPVYRHVL